MTSNTTGDEDGPTTDRLHGEEGPTPDPFRGEDGDPVVPDGWTHGTVEANGIEVSYYRVDHRDTQTVVLAHGYYEDARCQRRLANELADAGYDVVAYDARGHGHTGAPADGYAPEDRVADLVGVLDALDFRDPVLYGHSMGGSTVAKAAADHGERVRAVVMEDPAAMRWPPEHDLDAIAEQVRADVRDELEKSFQELLEAYEDDQREEDDEREQDDKEGEDDGESDGTGTEIPPELFPTFARSDQRMSEHIAEIPRSGYPPMPDVFPEIDVPALVLRRDADPDERVQDLELAESLTEGRLVHVPDAGHHVVLTEPEAAFKEIRGFLRHIGVDDTTVEEPERPEGEPPDLGDQSLDVTYRDDGRPARLDDAERPAPTDWEIGTVEANGIELAYYRVGDREDPTLVVAHGLMGDSRCMREQIATFADDHDVVAYDSRGHGHSDAPAEGYAPEDRVADLVGLLDALDLENPVLYGHSLGATTVGLVAAEHTDRIRGAVLEEPNLHGQMHDDLEELAEFMRADIEDAHASRLETYAADFAEEFPEWVEGRDRFAEWCARAMHRTSTHAPQYVTHEGFGASDRFAEMTVPVLVLVDDFAPELHHRDLEAAAKLPNGRLVTLPDTGHHAFLDDPEAAEAEVRAFLARVTDRDE